MVFPEVKDLNLQHSDLTSVDEERLTLLLIHLFSFVEGGTHATEHMWMSEESLLELVPSFCWELNPVHQA